MRRFRAIAAVLAAASLASVANAVPEQGEPVWVEMAPEGGSTVRLLTAAAQCPPLVVDSRSVAMRERAAPSKLPVRSNKAGNSEATVFPGRICELALPRTARLAKLNAQALPLPRARINRIVLIGDTGCRLKAADNAWQSCNDPAQWPFARVAARAAALHPDLVLHVGDYHYRENACPDNQPGCSGSIWGYGEAAWRADFLEPAAPLLGAAPWVVVRGNHEECARAGQGWWRLLDPHPLFGGRDCLDPANDTSGNRTEPYTIDLGLGVQLIVADLAGLANAKQMDSATMALYRNDFAQLGALTKGARTSFVTAHYPFNAVLWGKQGGVSVGSGPTAAFAPLALAGVRAMIAGHVHALQFARIAAQPTQVVAGFSGTMEDEAPAPASLAEARGKPGADRISALTTVAGRFGFALIERSRLDWRVTAYGLDGSVLCRFAL